MCRWSDNIASKVNLVQVSHKSTYGIYSLILCSRCDTIWSRKFELWIRSFVALIGQKEFVPKRKKKMPFIHEALESSNLHKYQFEQSK